MHSRSESLTLAPGLSREYLLHHGVCPQRYEGDEILVVAAAANAFTTALDEIAVAYQREVRAEPIARPDLERLIERLSTGTERTVELARADEGDDEATADVRDLANQPPVVRYVNLLVRDAYDAAASDIHLEATRTGLVARFRLDGILVPAPEPPRQLHHAVVSRLKLLAELDIAERRRPQDGRIRVRLEDRELDLRVSTVPTVHGESVVLRLLERGGRPVRMEELGMPQSILGEMLRLAQRPHGMLLVTGPTGSGKTTTLYSALQTRNAPQEKIITVEDPVEYQLAGVTQVPVLRQAGVTFATALRAILRQDPDVVMVGEMRDQETADIAVQAAMTGHLVFTTLHTNDSLGAVPRMLDLGVPDYLVAGTVEAVMAQRLVRRICDGCRTKYEPSPDQVAALTGKPVLGVTLERGVGCPACRGTGFRGRVGIFELLVMTDGVREAIATQATRAQLRAAALADGWSPIRTDGWEKVKAGLTTVEEVFRVVQD
jgi:general secretion pathway protein E